MNRMVAVLVVLTALQALIWTELYTLGYESVSELIKHYRTH